VDTVIEYRDGVRREVVSDYCPTPREASSGTAGVRSVRTTGGVYDKIVRYEYAAERYPGMAERGMLAQPYSTTILRHGLTEMLESCNWMTWKELSSPSIFVPAATWTQGAEGDSIRVVDFTGYDGFANPTSTTDVHGAAVQFPQCGTRCDGS
jgi:hypothetical protein